MRISDWSSDVCSSDLSPWLGTGLGRSGFRLNVRLTRELGRVTCMINQPEQGTEWFDVLHAQREANEHDVGGQLRWDQLARKSVVEGESVSVRVDLGGGSITRKENITHTNRKLTTE